MRQQTKMTGPAQDEGMLAAFEEVSRRFYAGEFVELHVVAVGSDMQVERFEITRDFERRQPTSAP